MTAANLANQGNINCYCCGYGVPRPPNKVIGYNQPGYRGEYYLLDAGQIKQLAWTPNRLSYEVDAPGPTSLIINQHAYPGWRVTGGTGTIYPYRGTIALRIPAGHQQIQVLYRPRH